jgi:hypothetical protein
MPLLPHQQRVVEERDELYDRLEKLMAFQDTPTFDALLKVERHLLCEQKACMEALVGVLNRRIALWHHQS